MLKSLVRKEVRELLPVITLGLVAQFYMVSLATGVKLWPKFAMGNSIPFVEDLMLYRLILAGGSAAVLFGFWQALGESLRGTWPFLLHRPAERTAILGVKLLVGAAATVVVGTLPILIYALWAATPGTNPCPFEWRFTVDTWNTCLAMPLLYFAAYSSGLRPARWYGSRLFPLACGLIVMLLLQMILMWSWIVPVLTLAVEACFVVIILHVGAQRDYS